MTNLDVFVMKFMAYDLFLWQSKRLNPMTKYMHYQFSIGIFKSPPPKISSLHEKYFE
jgi:hypothetical protein